jgi:hypothetical protein
LRFDGWILGAAFASGDRFVVGSWPRSPLGSFADVMWARPDGTRMLLAPNETVATFVRRHYSFDGYRLTTVHVEVSPRRLRVVAGPLVLELELMAPSLLSRLLRLRPRWLRTLRPWITLEDAVLRPIVSPLLGWSPGIRARGRTRDGAREWYAIHAFRRAAARARLDGCDLGACVPARPSGFGFSEFPAVASAVRVTSLFEP